MEEKNRQMLICFYGDDFTGSTDTMEALTWNGIKTVLFLEPPSPQLLAERFSEFRGFGVAGISRSMGPEEMEKELRPLFEQLSSFPTPIFHYKICSTFDSSPDTGSIGKAIDIARDFFANQRYIPLVVGAPALRRYTLFGQHYAATNESVFRLDRHPTMSRHPVTPMDEADLRMHLSRQTKQSVGLMDLLDLGGDEETVRQRLNIRLADHPDVLLFDVLDEERLCRTGQVLWEGALRESNRFVVGSSGVEYALAGYWRKSGMIEEHSEIKTTVHAVDRMLAVSGSCSPVTQSQIDYALQHGFVGVQIPAEQLLDPVDAEQTRSGLLDQASDILRQGRSPLLYTALGPEDPAIADVKSKLAARGRRGTDTGALIGTQLGSLTKEILTQHKLTRLIVAGGDTSGFVTRELGIYALECLMPIAPGGPLCRGYSQNADIDGIEFVLKGGQVGAEDYFVRVRNGNT